MSGYEKNRFLQAHIPLDLLCTICTLGYRNAVQCEKCKIISCQDCSKKTPLTCDHKFLPQKSLRQKMNDQLIKCKYWTRGCMEITKIGALEDHERNQCYYADFSCNKKECEEISLPGKIRHMQDCGYFMISCDICKKELRKNDVFLIYFNLFYLLIYLLIYH